MIVLVTLQTLSSVSSEAARLAIQSDRADCPVELALTAQALLDQGLGPTEVAYILRKMGE